MRFYGRPILDGDRGREIFMKETIDRITSATDSAVVTDLHKKPELSDAFYWIPSKTISAIGLGENRGIRPLRPLRLAW